MCEVLSFGVSIHKKCGCISICSYLLNLQGNSRLLTSSFENDEEVFSSTQDCVTGNGFCYSS